MTRPDIDNRHSRRTILGGAAALATGALLPSHVLAADEAVGAEGQAVAKASKPNSVFSGVPIGCITYSYRGGEDTAEATLKNLLADGLSETELMGGPIANYAGITFRRRGRRSQENELPIDAARPKVREEQLAKCVELRKMYNDAGVNIHIHKSPFGRTDEEIDFNFQIAKALGCKAITTERNDAQVKRLAPFAEKHKVWVAFHNHTKNIPTIENLDPLMNVGDYVGFNLDIGHYVAGTGGKSPIPVLEKYHDKIISLHLKDRTADGGNLPWGEGDTPIKEVLQLLKQEQWPIYADIEVEYKIPEGSNPVKEVARCVDYCREALA